MRIALVLLFAACGGLPDGADEADLSTATANRAFTTQWGPTRWNTAAHPDGWNDCGPTTALMALAALNVAPLEPPASVEAQIMDMRALMHPGSTTSSATYTPMLISGFEQSGVVAGRVPATLAGVDAALAHGVVAIGGDPRDAWGKRLSDQGAYLHRYGASDHYGHWVLVLGHASGGRYVVNDPLSVNGAIVVSGSAIERYFADGIAPQWTVAVGIQR